MCLLFGSLNDCGWRSRPRNVPLEVLRGNGCLQRGGVLYGKSAEKNICQDLNDYYALGDAHVLDEGHRLKLNEQESLGEENAQHGFYNLAQCGYGTHTDKCGERVVYVHADAPGGCEQTCYNPVMERFMDSEWKDRNKFDYSTFCSDGGEGSRRVLFNMPRQRDPRPGGVTKHLQEHVNQNWNYYDFVCEPVPFSHLCDWQLLTVNSPLSCSQVHMERRRVLTRTWCSRPSLS